jgi:hypothetical protein
VKVLHVATKTDTLHVAPAKLLQLLQLHGAPAEAAA